jgi:hypothetical protein
VVGELLGRKGSSGQGGDRCARTARTANDPRSICFEVVTLAAVDQLASVEAAAPLFPSSSPTVSRH